MRRLKNSEKRFVRALVFFFAFLVALFAFSLSIFAEETESAIPKEDWDGFLDSVPPEVLDQFPDGEFSEIEGYSGEINEMITPSYIVDTLLEMLGVEAGSAFKLLFLLIGVVVVSAVVSALAKMADNPALRSALRYCSLGAVFASSVYAFYEHFEKLEIFFERISALFNGMIPVTASIWALGGNVTTASAGSATLYCFLAVFEKLWAASAIPVTTFVIMLGFCDVLCGELKTCKIVGSIKKIYGFFLGISMTVLLSSLAAQTLLCAVSDSVAARTGRLVSSTVIPIIGGNLGEALRTVASSVGYLKGVFGVGGIVIIALLTIPMALTVLLARFAFGIGSAFADVLGCEEESKLLSVFSDAYGCMLAVVCGVGMMFVLALCIFMKTVVAVA